MPRMNPDELVRRLRALQQALDVDAQTACGLFGLLFADHMEAHNRDGWAPNAIGDRAGLSGVDVNTGFKAARYVRVEVREEYARRTGQALKDR